MSLAKPTVVDGDRRLLLKEDLVESIDPLRRIEGEFDGVTIFGLMHHIPQRHRRQRLLQHAAQRVGPGGWLAFTRWRFAELDRFRKRIVPWDGLANEGIGRIDRSELEPGDHLLKWGDEPPALRYCHAMTTTEAQSIVEELPLRLAHRFLADGRENSLNEYYVLARTEPD